MIENTTAYRILLSAGTPRISQCELSFRSFPTSSVPVLFPFSFLFAASLLPFALRSPQSLSLVSSLAQTPPCSV